MVGDTHPLSHTSHYNHILIHIIKVYISYYIFVIRWGVGWIMYVIDVAAFGSSTAHLVIFVLVQRQML